MNFSDVKNDAVISKSSHGNPLSLWLTVTFHPRVNIFTSKVRTVTCASRQCTVEKKSWLWRCGTRSESTHVFNSTSSNRIKEEKGAETAALSTYTVIHLHLALCWRSSVATAYARFTTSLGPLGWMEKWSTWAVAIDHLPSISFTEHTYTRIVLKSIVKSIVIVIHPSV